MMSEYMKQRLAMKLKGKPSKETQRSEKMKKSDFFEAAIKNAPKKCQECGNSLALTLSVTPSVVVAHILPKRKAGGCPSVANNPANIVYLCYECHTKMDNFGGKRDGGKGLKKMKIFPLLQDRVAEMWYQIADNEKKNVPEALRP